MASAGKQEEYRRLLCKIRKLSVWPNVGWVRFVTVPIAGMLPLKAPYPPAWKPGRKRNFNMIYQMPNRGERTTTKCGHCHRVIDHHLSVGLSSAVYRPLNPPLGEETTPDIQCQRMKNVMDEGICQVFHFIITQNKMPTGKHNAHRMSLVNPALISRNHLLNRIAFIERTANFYERACTNKFNPIDFCSC